MARKKIILVEDEQDLADLVAMRLKREHYDVAVAHDGLVGLEMIRKEKPDLVLLDVMLPSMAGTQIITELRKDPATAHLPAIMLTARSEESDIVVGLSLGADDYITKPFSMSVLTARITSLLRRANLSQQSTDHLLKAGAITIDINRHLVTVDDSPVTLTLTEFRLVEAIIKARGRVLSRYQLIDKALGPDAVVTDRTVDVHITSLRRKLGLARHCIKTVRGVGYCLADK